MGGCSGKSNNEITDDKQLTETRSSYHALPLRYQFDLPSNASIWTRGLAITDKNQIVVCFRNQFKLLVFDVDGEFMQSCEMAHRPYNAAIIPDSSQLVVTLPGIQSLQYVDTVNWTPGKQVQTRGYCWGISITSNNIVVGGDDEIYVMDIDGCYQYTIPVPGNCVRYFALATREDETKIYFTSQNNNIQCISMDGKDMFSFTSPGLISPAGLAIDDLGILFVAGFGSFKIHQLKLDGNDIENTIILKKEDGVKQSKALCFNKDRSQLYITVNGGKSLLIYNTKN